MKRTSLLLSGVLLLAVVGVMSLLPPETKFALHTQGALHLWLHFGAFALVAFLLTLGLPSSAPRLRGLAIVVVVLFGIGTEIGEHFINATPLESSDIFADTVGAILGLMAALFLKDS